MTFQGRVGTRNRQSLSTLDDDTEGVGPQNRCGRVAQPELTAASTVNSGLRVVLEGWAMGGGGLAGVSSGTI